MSRISGVGSAAARMMDATPEPPPWLDDGPAEPKPARASKPAKPEPLFQVATVDGSHTEPLKPPQFAMDRLLPVGEVTLMAADGGIGKTTLALAMALHIEAGRPWAGYRVTRGRVAFLSLEDPLWLAEWRLSKARAALQTTSKLDIVTPGDVDTELFGLMHDGSLGPTPLGVQLAEFLSHGAYRVIVVDNASEAFGGNENVRREVRAFIHWLRRIARKANAAVLLLAHIDKASARGGKAAGAGSAYSGSSAWNNSVRSRIALFGNADDQVELIHEKANWCRPAPPVALGRNADGVLLPIERQTTATAEEAEAQRLAEEAERAELVLDAIKRAIDDGTNVNASRNGPGNVLALCTRYGLTLAAAPVWAAVDRLKSEGRLVVRNVTVKGEERKRLTLPEPPTTDMPAPDVDTLHGPD